MAKAAPRACTRGRCGGIVTDGVCDRCGPRKPPPDRRPSARKRGYTSDWEKLRLAKLVDSPLCEECGRKGLVQAATEVHHLDKVSDGNPVLCRLDRLQSLCRWCHQAKTARGE